MKRVSFSQTREVVFYTDETDAEIQALYETLLNGGLALEDLGTPTVLNVGMEVGTCD